MISSVAARAEALDRMVRRDAIVAEIMAERQRQICDHGYHVYADSGNDRNDWVAYICAYVGRAAACKKNKDEDYRKRMVKVAALAVAAIEAFDCDVSSYAPCSAATG